jgi:hypothetical protein
MSGSCEPFGASLHHLKGDSEVLAIIKERTMPTDNISSGLKVVDFASYIAGPSAAISMNPPESTPPQGSRSVLTNRRFLACRECGWVHYVMTVEEKAASDRFLEWYQLSETERLIYESAFL